MGWYVIEEFEYNDPQDTTKITKSSYYAVSGASRISCRSPAEAWAECDRQEKLERQAGQGGQAPA